ncbi:MAG: D-alanyl-D-alanine carboxypeptidase [Cytophagaceae bacterium]|nr:D-alanyl-D-alanine carboxypeptidase [Cytophagaceae bacterium]
MKKLLATVFLSFLFLSCATLKRTSRHIDTVFKTSPALQSGFAGLVIYDPVTHKTLYSHNPSRYFTPASNTKLFTFYTGLKVLGDSIPAIRYAIKNDTLYFKGTGDPSFLYGEFDSRNVLGFLASAEEKLVLVKPNYTEAFFGPGWAWDDYNDYYSVERNDFPIYGNVVRFKYDTNKKLPKIYPSVFQDSTFIRDHATHDGAVREMSRNSFWLQAKKPTEDYTQLVPFKTSPKTTQKLLSDTLHREVGLMPQAPLKLDRTIYSVPADSLYKAMLYPSDNFIAEQLLLVAADKIADTLKTKIAIDHMKEDFLKDLPDEPKWFDGSGLTRYNLFTPRTMVALLNKITEEKSIEDLKKLLPAGGKTGTLKNYYKAEEPYIFAKTGSLSNNHSLSGLLITKSGKTLIFSFMNSNYTASTRDLKAAMEEILLLARDKY